MRWREIERVQVDTSAKGWKGRVQRHNQFSFMEFSFIFFDASIDTTTYDDKEFFVKFSSLLNINGCLQETHGWTYIIYENWKWFIHYELWRQWNSFFFLERILLLILWNWNSDLRFLREGGKGCKSIIYIYSLHNSIILYVPRSQYVPSYSKFLHSHNGPESVDIQMPPCWHGSFFSHASVTLLRKPCECVTNVDQSISLSVSEIIK